MPYLQGFLLKINIIIILYVYFLSCDGWNASIISSRYKFVFRNYFLLFEICSLFTPKCRSISNKRSKMTCCLVALSYLQRFLFCIYSKSITNSLSLVVGGFTSNNKTMVVWSAYAMGRSEVLWGRDWRRFEPSRWLDPSKPVPPHFAIPFQTGNCRRLLLLEWCE